MEKRYMAGLVMTVFCAFASGTYAEGSPRIHLAVEFVDHAASAYVAKNQQWFKEAGLKVTTFDSYATGMTLSAALCKGGINAAYMCLLPAINAYANGKVPIKIVAGTHLYGYGLVVNPKKIKTIVDLAKPGIRLGCTREGSPSAALLQKLVATHHLDRSLVTGARRMPPSKLFLSLTTGQLDAAFFPEQYPSMAEMVGFKELRNAKDLWPAMQGSVLVVSDALLKNHPEAVEKLVQITRRGIEYINAHPQKAAEIVAHALAVTGKEILPINLSSSFEQLVASPAAIETSLKTKLENSLRIDRRTVQQMIDYAAQLGYIKHAFAAENILDLRYVHE